MAKGSLKIVADENIPALEHYFSGLGDVHKVHGRTLTRAQLADADVLLVRSVTPVNAALLEGTPVRFVGSCTIGTDHLDTEWLDAQRIAWSAAPGCNANSVVEYVFCALATLGVDWRGRSFGIVGCGNVGGLLQRRLHEIGIACAVYDPWLPDNPDSAPLAKVLQQDIVCLHAPLVRGGEHPSEHLLGASELALLREGAVLLSAGRGGVIDNRALLDALRAGKPMTAILDVWENEPNINAELLEQVDLATPHIAGYSYDGKLAGTRMIRAALAESLGELLADSGAGADDAGEGLEVHALHLAHDADSDFAVLANLLQQIYDPREDDQRLRAVATGDLGTAFDRLRREYPRRLEFSHYTLGDIVLDAEQRRQLAILGLQ